MKRQLLAIWLMVLSPVALGSEIALLIEMLYENGTVSEAQYQRLQAEMAENQQRQQQAQQIIDDKLAEAAKPKGNTSVRIGKGGLTVATDDGAFKTQISGRLQLDAAAYSGDPEQGDGTKVRRAYLTLKGRMYQDWGYRLQYNFASTGSNGKGILDAYIDYTGFDHVDLRVGQFKEPFTLHEATSDNFVTFMERSLNAAFSPGRKLGVMAKQANDDRTWAIGLFGESVSTARGAVNEGWGLSGRYTLSPINEADRVLHLGAGANYRNVDSVDTVRFRQQAETRISGVNLVDTGAISDAKSVLKLSGELAWVNGPFAMQGEYIDTQVERDAMGDVDFSGWYLETSYFLTGESRQYRQGRFGRPKVNAVAGQGGLGAWQLALRYSDIDLNDGLIQGGEAEAVTLGLNWYPTPTLRFTANYVDVLSINDGPQDDETPSVFQVRSQWAF